MKKLLKIVVGALVAVLLLATLGLVLLGVFFDPNEYKAEIQALVRDQTQLDLQIEGELGWTLFPWLGLKIPGVRVAQSDGSPLASLNQAQVSVKITSLFKGQLQMSALLIEGLKLDLVRDAEGHGNWELASAQTPDAETPEDEPHSGDPGGLLLDIGAVDIRDAQISFDDQQQQRKMVLSRFNFSGQDVVSGRDFPVTMDFLLQLYGTTGELDLSLDTELKAHLLVDLAQQVYRAQQLDLDLQIQGAMFNGQKIPVQLQATAEADLKQDRAVLESLQLKLANLGLKGSVEITQMMAAPTLKGDLVVSEFNLHELLAALGQPPIKTQGPEALKRISFSSRLEGPANTLGLKDLRLQLDESHFSGAFSQQLKSGAMTLALKGDHLDLDAYLPPPSGEDAAKSDSASTSAPQGPRYSKTPLLPLEIVRGLKLNADLGLDELTTSGLKIEAISLKVRADGGLIEIPEVAGKLYEGAFNNRATIDARRAPVTFKIHKAITAVQLGGMLQDLSDTDLFTGTFDMVGDYRAKGNSIYAIVNSLDGKMTLNVANGRLQGVNLVDKLCRGLLQLRGVQPTESGVADYTEFSNLGGSVVINSGVMDNRDLTAALAGVNLDGAGSVDLPNEALDYGLSLTILQELKGPNCQIEEKLHNLAFPVRCRGGFDDDPKKMCRPDTDKMKQVIAELGTREVKEKVQKKLEEKFKDNDAIKGLLKGLF